MASFRRIRVCVAGSYDYLYRMRALDAIRDIGKLLLILTCFICHKSFPTVKNPLSFLSIDLPFRELGGMSTAVTGKRLRTWLLQLRNSNCMLRDSVSSLVYTVLDGYNKARHGAEVSEIYDRIKHFMMIW